MYYLLKFRFCQNYVSRRCLFVLQREINIDRVRLRTYTSKKEEIIDRLENLDQKIQKIVQQKTIACLETKCKLEENLLPKCKAGDAVVARKESVQSIPEDCDRAKVEDTCIRPYVNPCTPYPVKPCSPYFRTLDPCRDPCLRRERSDNEEKRKITTLSMKTMKILLGLTTLIAVIIMYKALTAEEQDWTVKTAKRGKKKMIRPKEPPKVPMFSGEVPSYVPYVIVGGGPAAYSAMKAITSLDTEAKVLIVNKEPYYPYDRTPINTELLTGTSHMARELEFIPQRGGKRRSIFYEEPEFYCPVKSLHDLDQPGSLVSVLRGWAVRRLDSGKKFIEIEDGKRIRYDKCILATGSSPKELRLFADNVEEVKERVSTYNTIYDMQLVDKITSYYGPDCTIAVVGGGINASELACSLRKRDVKVIQVYKEPGNMHELLPQYLSNFVTEKMKDLGVVILNNAVVQDAVIWKGEREQIGLSVDLGGPENYLVLADHVIVSAGNKPNTELAEGSDIEIDKRNGGFLVNRELQVCKDLYAAGDCISYYDSKYGRRRIQNYEHAVESGKIAAENLLGENKTFDFQSMFWADVMPKIGCEAMGVVDPDLSTVGVYVRGNEGDKGAEKIMDNRTSNTKEQEDIYKGVVFYLKNETVVGILTWNVFGRAPLIRRILQKDFTYKDINDVAKFLSLHL